MGEVMMPLPNYLNEYADGEDPEHKFYFPMKEKYLALAEEYDTS